MTDSQENKITVLSKEDPNLPEFLDFKRLRNEGLEHIGSLSGKIWTDHNVHDPGITILEALIYALMDLGYKTNLPFKDLVTPENVADKDDNFLTPLEILTVNPVTITDYRKLLLEIKGVRNAWLEPVAQKKQLFIDQRTNTIVCDRPDPIEPNIEVVYDTEGGFYTIETPKDCAIETPFVPLSLNGLYKVLIEKDTDIVQNEEDEKNLIKEVKKLLAAHRNLCEDFRQICVLTPVDIGVCAQVEIAKGYAHEKVYGQIIKAVMNFVQPQIKYYTLKTLLDKGKTIDEIFAGRPHRKESFGFVDTEEFEALKRRDEMHLSDLYSIILSIEGVLKVVKVNFKGGLALSASDYCKVEDGGVSSWVRGIRILNDQVPVFSLDTSCIDLYSVQGFIPIDKSKIHQTFSFPKKFNLPYNELNCNVPQGIHREDLTVHHSIQNDFPVVYGIGEDGLPERATLLRKTQALQLKGYLLFYDQMLANYASQLSHIRSLYALTPESQRSATEKQTYFAQLPDAIPGAEDLLQFYEAHEQLTTGSRLAVPVARDMKWNEALSKLKTESRTRLTIADYCDEKVSLLRILTFPSAAIRTIYMNQLVDSFFNENYTIEVDTDIGGYFFVLCPEIPNDVVLVSTKRYESFSEAINQGKSIAFLCALQATYSLVSDLTNPTGIDQHYFNLHYSPLSYIDLIQGLTEQKEEYLGRRKQFLDHLLARFGEEFTDYTLLQYQHGLSDTQVNEETIVDQSSYVNQFAELSRNRAKAFDYLEDSWNSDNVSGFEKRASLLAGIDNYERRNLCNFEVSPCFKLHLEDWQGNTLFRGNRSYDSKEDLYLAAEKVLLNLRSSDTYDRLEKNLNGFNGTSLFRIFSKKPAKENIKVAESKFHHQLLDAHGTILRDDKHRKHRYKKTALSKEKPFIADINSDEGTDLLAKKYRLLPIGRQGWYVDTQELECDIKTRLSYKWHKLEEKAKKMVKSDQAFAHEKEAWNQLIAQPETSKYLTAHENALQWKLLIKNTIELYGADYHPDRAKSVTAWRQAKMLGSIPNNYTLEVQKETTLIKLNNEKGKCIATSKPIPNSQVDSETLIDDCVRVFANRSTKPNYQKVKEKFGFRIPNKSGASLLVSYGSYDSEREALEQMEKVFVLGQEKKNYLLSGDEGNPEYNFILRDRYDSFIALPSEHSETATDRNSSLKSTTLYLKNNKVPVLVAEEARRYQWSLKENDEVILTANREFPSKTKAQADFDKTIVAKAEEGALKLLQPHYYQFNIKEVPSRFDFLYGTSSTDNELEPIFRSATTYASSEEAEKAYESFANNLSVLTLKIPKNKDSKFEYELYHQNSQTPLAVQYVMATYKAPVKTAREIISYFKGIYTKDGNPKARFIANSMAENSEVHYEWRFYKKNSPLATSPYYCPEKAMTERIEHKICDLVPPVSLKECPPKDSVVCPKKNPGKYHFQVCFKDDKNREFVLYSYIGYDSREEAAIAWASHWIAIIDAARTEENYGSKGLISLQEVYKDPSSNACDEASFIAVVPEEVSRRLQDAGIDVKAYFLELANLFPIYRLPPLEEHTCSTKYVYRVTVPEKELIPGNCKNLTKLPFQGSLLWESVACYDTIEEVIAAYCHFYTLAGTPNNCRIFCKYGEFYVGLVEVLVESACEFISPEEAWDDTFPDNPKLCDPCNPGGLREFIYAAEDCNNYIPICDHKYWKFKVVSPYYFVVNHNCYYDSEKVRDKQMVHWIQVLKEIDWTKYINKETLKSATADHQLHFLTHFIVSDDTQDRTLDDLCEWVEAIRECLPRCIKKEKTPEVQWIEMLGCLRNKFKKNEGVLGILKNPAFDLDALIQLSKYFPVYKTGAGYCYRLYRQANDKTITPDGLQPCGCEDVKSITAGPCDEPYIFVSSNCYSCCEEALSAFMEFCELVKNGLLEMECTQKTPFGPYSFQLIDRQKELGYHPQQYDCLQEVNDAIEITKRCVNNTGMHLLEHILLRPKKEDCTNESCCDDTEQEDIECCTLPICPDYCCDIKWQPDLEKDDPCRESDSNLIYYIPGSDPYSFWATLALPAWDKRFRSQEARQAFEKFLYKEVPALVGLHILWLSPRNMCKFEDAYRGWLEWKQDPCAEICFKGDLSPTCLLVACIKDLVSEDPCVSVPGAKGDCECEPADVIREEFCCLPAETLGTLFWGFCPPELLPQDDPVDDVVPFSAEFTVEATADISNVNTKSNSKKTVAKKKTISKKSAIKVDKKKLMALVRKRKPQYLKNVKAVADDSMQQTKSFERAQFFLKNAPTLDGYVKLVDFFNRYSLQKDNNLDGFFRLIKNATWHMLDALVLDQNKKLSKAELDKLKQPLQKLKSKGLSLKNMAKEWKVAEIGSLANGETMTKLIRLLK